MISTKVLPDGRTIVYTTTPGVVLHREYEPSPYGFTGVVNRAWIEAANAVGRQYTEREIEHGWPLAMEPHRLANLQHPQDSTGQTYINTALLSACKTGQLRCTAYKHHDYALQPNGGGKLIEVWTDYAITAPTFAAWLARQGEEPSTHIAAWFKAAGVAPAPAPSPPAAPVTDSPPGGMEPATGKRWTTERKAELKAYREKHGTEEAARQYGISAARVRALLPSDKPQPKGYSAFTHRPK